MPTVTGGPFKRPNGTLLDGVVTFQLAGQGGRALAEAAHADTDDVITGASTVELVNGTYTIDVPANEDIAPAGTRWARTSPTGSTRYLDVDQAGGPEQGLYDDPPGTIESSALTVHKADLTAHGDPLGQVIEHRWGVGAGDWSALTPVVMSADGAQQFVTTVVDGRGIVTGTEPGDGGHRVAYLLDGSGSVDAELRQVIWPPTADWDGGNAQQGGLHRVREISPGVWEAIAVWTTIVGGQTYNFLHARAVRFDGTDLFQGGGGAGFGASDDVHIDRASRIVSHERLFFGDWLNVYTLQEPSRLRYLSAGDLVSISGIADGTFNETDIAVTGPPVNAGTLNVVEPTTLEAGAQTLDNQAAGVAPSGVDVPKRFTPFVLATRVVGGSASSVTVEAKRWRPEDPEPDWGDPRVRRGTVTPNVDVPDVATGPGQVALWAAHFHDDSGGAWGDIDWRNLDT